MRPEALRCGRFIWESRGSSTSALFYLRRVRSSIRVQWDGDGSLALMRMRAGINMRTVSC